ncbi:MAG: MBL fold metallo-hydrolase [Bacteroidota bacterium]
MKIKFCGGAKTVTGSCHLLEMDNGYQVLLDCGLYQGNDEDFATFNEDWLFDPAALDCMILSHAHIDHCGRIPKLVRDGFRGNIYCTSATRDLAAIMLMDSAHIQEMDAKWDETEPLYEKKDALEALDLFVGVAYNRWFRVGDEIEVLFKDAGHILGSASVTLKVHENGKESMVGYTGDIGRPNRPILRDPQPMPDVDVLLCESTYGGKEHQGVPQDMSELEHIIHETCVVNKGKLLIPAFSVGRTQEVLYVMDRLETEGKLPPVDVFLDSPLAIDATDIFMMHPECYDQELTEFTRKDIDPFKFPNLHITRSAQASKAIKDFDKPCVIISASGMMQGGRIRHHLANNIDDPRTTLLIVGFCAPGTLGAHLRSYPDKAWIFGVQKEVKAQIKIMDSFSAHADQGEIIDFLQGMDRKRLKRIFLVHGEGERQHELKSGLKDEGFADVVIPSYGESFDV